MAKKKPITRRDRMGFEVTDCSRCNGSGKYSYCQAYGDMCFKCHGTGIVRTLRGAKAYDRFLTSQSRQIADIENGDLVFMSPKWRKLENIKPDEYNPGYVVLTFSNGSSLMTRPDGTIKSVKDDAHYTALLSQAVQSQEPPPEGGLRGDVMEYRLLSVKNNEIFKGTKSQAIKAAIKMEEEYQPAFGVTIEGMNGGETIAEIRDGKVE